MTYRIIDSPIGPITLVVDDEDALLRLNMVEHKHLPDPATFGPRDDTVAGQAAEQLAEYFEGLRTQFDLRLAPHGTAFQLRVWQVLREIPYGQTWTYGQVADKLGAPKSARAVGAAVGRNPISIIVPCHRVVGADGQLIGYAGGIDRKRWLLAHEQGKAQALVPGI